MPGWSLRPKRHHKMIKQNFKVGFYYVVLDMAIQNLK